MARTRRRLKIYLVIFLILLVVAVFLPTIIETVSDYFHSEQAYYYPHDLQRGDYMEQQGEK